MRGTLESLSGGFPVGGIIPAYAGNTGLHLTFRRFRWDHPRVCGEHRIFFFIDIVSMGIIPAYAGNTHVG